MSSANISFMVTPYFIGIVLGGFFCTLPDTYGRKRSCIFALFMASVAQTIVIFIPDYRIRFAMFFILGLTQIKNCVCYNWLSECTSQPYKALSFTYINMFDSLTVVITCTHFLLISRDWINVPLVFCGITWLAFLLSLMCPESPRWHLI